MTLLRPFPLTMLLITGLTAILYGPTVGLPLFLDDASNFRWLTPTNGLHVWITAEGFPFYRPLPFTLFKLLWHLQGGYNPPTLHAVVSALHGFNALLVGLLAARITRHRWALPTAAALMLVFPFTYQAVALVGSIFHLALVAGTVGAALLGLHYISTGARWALVAAWLAGFAGTFSHESGVMLPALVGLALLLADRESFRRQRGRLAALLLPLVIFAALYFGAWLAVPKANDASGLQLADLDAKLAYIGQGLVYPLSALIRPLFADAPAVVPAALILTLLGGGGALLSLWRRRDPPALIAALGGLAWIALASVPGLLLLATPYLLGGPRLLYLASAGIALFWTAWALSIMESRAGKLAAGIVLAALIGVGAVFTVVRVGDYGRLGAFYWDVIDAVTAHPEESTLVVNAPAFTAPRRGAFLLGAEGATYLVDYITLQELVWVNTGERYAVETVAFANTLVENPDEIFSPRGPWVDWDGLDAAIVAADAVFAVRFTEDGAFALAHVGDRAASERDSAPLGVFPAASLDTAAFSGDGITLTWTAEAAFPGTVFVHALCGSEVGAQADGAPLGGLHPFDRWAPGERWIEHRQFTDLPCPTPDAIHVGLYDPADPNQRLPAALPDGTTADHVTIIPPG